MKTLLVTTALAGILAASSAQADVYIGLAKNGDPITTVASGLHAASWSGQFGPIFNFQNLGVTDLFAKLASVSLNVLGTAPGDLNVWFTTTDQGGIDAPLKSGMTTNFLPGGWTVDISTWLDYGNAIYAETIALGSAHFGAIGTDTDVAPPPLSQPYSVTAHYLIHSSGRSLDAALSTATVTAIPEPATNLMLLGSLLTLGGLYLRPGRRRSSAEV